MMNMQELIVPILIFAYIKKIDLKGF